MKKISAKEAEMRLRVKEVTTIMGMKMGHAKKALAYITKGTVVMQLENGSFKLYARGDGQEETIKHANALAMMVNGLDSKNVIPANEALAFFGWDFHFGVEKQSIRIYGKASTASSAYLFLWLMDIISDYDFENVIINGNEHQDVKVLQTVANSN